jgi:hypothetical protein
MKALSCLVAFTVAICGLVVIELRLRPPPRTLRARGKSPIHNPPPDGDYQATYVLKQDGEKITGEYQGMYGPAAVTGSIKSDDVVLRVTVKGTNAEFTGKVSSAAKMSGTVTGTSDQPRK